MKQLFALCISLFFSVAYSKQISSCDVETLADAQACMDKIAENHPEYNLPNIGSASVQKDKLKKVFLALGKTDPKLENKINAADFVGVMLEKGDEWYLYYYAIKKGQSKNVVELGNQNLVDLGDDLVQPVMVIDLILGDGFKKFDREDRGWIREYLIY